MPRAYGKGYLRLSLVTCPIDLIPATSQSEKTHLHQINPQTGHRLRQQMIDVETGRAVIRNDAVSVAAGSLAMFAALRRASSRVHHRHARLWRVHSQAPLLAHLVGNPSELLQCEIAFLFAASRSGVPATVRSRAIDVLTTRSSAARHSRYQG